MQYSIILSAVSVFGLVAAQTTVTGGGTITGSGTGATSSDAANNYDGCGSETAKDQLSQCIYNLTTQQNTAPCGVSDWTCKCAFEKTINGCYGSFCPNNPLAVGQQSTVTSYCSAASSQPKSSTTLSSSTPKKTGTSSASAAAPSGTSGTSTSNGTSTASSSPSASNKSGASAKVVSVALLSIPAFVVYIL